HTGTLSANGTNKCFIEADTAAHAATYLAAAISNATGTNGSSTSTWLCTGGDSPNTLANLTSTVGSSTVTLQAQVAGASGFAFTTGVTNFTTFSSTAGTDGSNLLTNFQIWSGAAGVSAATLGTNIAAAITRNSASTLATASGTTTVAVTAVNSGVAGNSITLSSGLTGFTWAGAGTLTGGAEGTNTTTFL